MKYVDFMGKKRINDEGGKLKVVKTCPREKCDPDPVTGPIHVRTVETVWGQYYK